MSHNEFETINTPEFPIVGLGASAGGIEAFKEFFQNLPSEPICAFVLIMHLDPHHKSMLPELIAKDTGLEVVQAKDKMEVKPGRIHIIPPNTTIYLREGVLRLEKLAANGRAMRRPIDDFFRSLAEELGPHAVGIVFSGTGSDGTQGLREIKYSGGLSMVQDPASAKYDSMPGTAVNAGVVDVSLPSAELAQRFAELLKNRGDVSQGVQIQEKEQNAELYALMDQIHSISGRDLTYYKTSTLMRRIEKRILLKERKNLQEYRKLIEEDDKELDSLLKELHIGVTSFFRDIEAYKLVEKLVIPALFNDKDKKTPIRVWVPGCATGEEAYSLAILFADYMQNHKVKREIQIFGTDIDEGAIEIARNGIYSVSALEDIPERFKEEYTIVQKDTFKTVSLVREMIVFAPHNLIENPPFFKLDFISCRNLLIYLTTDTQKKIFPLFYYALLPERYLLLGTAETLGTNNHLFKNLDNKWKLFQRTNIANTKVELPMTTKGVWHHRELLGSENRHEKNKQEYAYILRDGISRSFGIPSILLNETDEIVQVFGDVHEFLGLSDGDLSNDVFRMAREPLKLHLRSAIFKARKNQEAGCI